MNKFFTILLNILFLFNIQKGLTQDYYLKYGLNDCPSCNYFLHQLSVELDGRPITFVFTNRFESDSSLLASQLGLSKFNYKLVFNDSLYKNIVKGEESYFIASTDGKYFTTKLKAFDIAGVKAIIQNDKYSTDASALKKCLVARNSDNNQMLINDSIAISTNRTLNRVTYHDINNNSYIEIVPDVNWTLKAYEKIYGKNNFQYKYDKYLKFIIEAPTLMHSEIKHTIKEGNKLYFYVDVKCWEYIDSVNDRISVSSKMTLFSYDISTQNLISCSLIPNEELDKYQLSVVGKFLKFNDTFYFFIMERFPTSSTKILARYKQVGDELIFDKIMDFTIPNTNIKYQFGNNFSVPVINKNLLSLQASDRIYDLHTGQTYLIPIEEEQFESLNGILEKSLKIINEGMPYDLSFYVLMSIADKGNGYGILYRDKDKGFNEVVFDKKTGMVLHKKKLKFNIDELEIFEIYYHPQNSELLVYNLINDPEKCLYFVEL